LLKLLRLHSSTYGRGSSGRPGIDDRQRGGVQGIGLEAVS
jgi:hypothetical protein